MVTEGPVFVVGPSRSGTALVRSLLNNHPTLHLVGETHYFDDLRPRVGGNTVLEDVGARRCEDYFLALTHRPYGHQGDPELATISRERLRRDAGELGRTPDAYFEAYCRLVASDEGSGLWGEKTPRHVFRIDDILETFPTARIVALVRDPRAVIASYRDWRNQGGFDLDADPELEAAVAQDNLRAHRSYNLVVHSMLWRSTANAVLAASARHGRSRIHAQRYEDLVREPETSARELFEWLGLDFMPELLDVPVHNSSFSAFDRRGGVSSVGLERWREKLADDEVAVVQSVCRSSLRACGYQPTATHGSRLALTRAYLGVLPGVVRAVASNRERIAGLPAYIWGRVRFLLR
jgi:hypothetical protein